MQCVEEPLVINNRRHDIHQLFTTDGVVTFCNVKLDYPRGSLPLPFDLSESGVARTTRAKAMRRPQESWLIDGFQHHPHGPLHHFVSRTRNG